MFEVTDLKIINLNIITLK